MEYRRRDIGERVWSDAGGYPGMVVRSSQSCNNGVTNGSHDDQVKWGIMRTPKSLGLVVLVLCVSPTIRCVTQGYAPINTALLLWNSASPIYDTHLNSLSFVNYHESVELEMRQMESCNILIISITFIIKRKFFLKINLVIIQYCFINTF